MSRTFWHGAPRPFAKLAPGRDGGIHMGTLEQAAMRNPAFLHEIRLDTGRVRRSKDAGGEWAGKIRAARGARFTSLVYLNRFEGIAAGDLDASVRLADAPDGEFRRGVPSARDSVIALYEEDPHVVRIVPGRGVIPLYAALSARDAEHLERYGADAVTASQMPLALTPDMAHAACGDPDATLLRLHVRACDLRALSPGGGGCLALDILRAEREGEGVLFASVCGIHPARISVISENGSPEP